MRRKTKTTKRKQVIYASNSTHAIRRAEAKFEGCRLEEHICRWQSHEDMKSTLRTIMRIGIRQ
jgi:hypothetical protein